MTGIGTVIDGKYEILKLIGKGGMSYVYLAMDNRLNKQWAVKEIRKTGSGRNEEIVVNSLLAEANLMKRLDHPALPRIVDIIDNGQTIYIVMDYIEGESLDKILERCGPQDEASVIGWAKQLCDALGYLHGQKPPIIYRDMKPGNIMLRPEGNIKIIDFGIAREYKEKNLQDTTVLGTKGYAPPEQYSGQTDARSDIYALGMTMHYLLTGVDPRSGEAYRPVRRWNPNLSEGIERIIDKCVQPAPENRYQTCAELLYDLEHPDLITKGYKRQQKRRLSSFIAAAALCAACLAGGILCRTAAQQMNDSDYEKLIAAVDDIDSYKAAIEIYPGDTRAYIRILEIYEDSGLFGPDEAAEFLALYNANKSSFDTASAGYAEMNYKIGTMYFSMYTEDDEGNYSLSARIQKAYPFFAANSENEDLSDEFGEAVLSECYYRICSFYKTYILDSASVEEASKESYETLISAVEDTLGQMSDAKEYDRLALCNATFLLLYNQKEAMACVEVDEDTVLTLFDEVYEEAASMVVQNEKSVTLQEEITTHYEEYRKAIVNTYENTQQRAAAASSDSEDADTEAEDAQADSDADTSDTDTSDTETEDAE